MGKRGAAIALFVVLCPVLAGTVAAQQKRIEFRLSYTTVHGGLKVAAPVAGESMPRLGLALAGGGAKAAASIGVLKVLEAEGIPVFAVAGTSMGAGVGGLYAAGYRPEEIERIFLANDWNDIFRDVPARSYLTQEQKESDSRYLLEFTMNDEGIAPPTGLSAGQKLMNLLAGKTFAASFEADFDFDRLPVRFRAIATNIETGEEVVLRRGLLHEAMRASAAVPIMFQPVEIDRRLLVDGGLVNNLPVEVVRSMGSEVVIAVDASAKLEKKSQLNSLFDIMSQSIALQVRRETERQAALADLVITPDIEDYSFADFPSMQAIIQRGEEAGRKALPRIREFMRPKDRVRAGMVRYHITGLDVRGNARVSEDSIRSAMTPVRAPREVTDVDLEKMMARVFRLGFFSDVALTLERGGAGYRSVLVVTENPVVKSISISGNTILPTEELMSVLSGQIGQPLNSARLVANLDAVVKQYRNQGYLLARVEKTVVREDGTLEIVLYEGRIDSIIVTGQEKTSRRLLRRETQTRAGQPLNMETAVRDIQHLYALDYFESVSVDAAKSAHGGVDLTLKIKEKPTNKIRLGLRYDLEDSFTGLTDLLVDNVTGRGIKLFLNTRYGNYTDVSLGYRSPLFLGQYFVHTVDGFYRERNYYLYQDKHKVKELDIARTGGEFAFGYQWFRLGDTYLRYRYASDSTEETFGVNPPKEIARIGSLTLLSTVDTRDSSAFAHKGALLRGSYESAAEAYGGDVKYTKTNLYGQGFLPLGERHTIMFEIESGLGSGDIPYEEKYGIGGADYLISHPLLGYERREFVGDDLFGLSAAYRWRIGDYQLNVVKAVYLNLMYQAANVWDRRDDMTVRDLRSGGGIGLYADTIIGPVRLDFGEGGQHRYAVYFSAGFDF